MVSPATINIMVNLLSFEKFLSKIVEAIPTSPSPMKLIPMLFANSTSKISPITIPYIAPISLLPNKPINNTSITNRFGITPAIVNQLKKFDCRKYITNAIIIKYMFIRNFFN